MLKVTRDALSKSLKRIIVIAISDLKPSGNVFRPQEKCLSADSLNSMSCGVRAKAISFERFLLTSSAKWKGLPYLRSSSLLTGLQSCHQDIRDILALKLLDGIFPFAVYLLPGVNSSFAAEDACRGTMIPLDYVMLLCCFLE